MRLLIIYYNFPPAKVPGAVRLKHVYEQSKLYFKDTFVLSCSNRKLYQQDPSLTVADGKIYEVPAYDVRRLLLYFRSSNTVQISTRSKKHFLYPLIAKILDSFPFNILIGDGGFFYILYGYRKGRTLIRQEGITHIFSTFRPYSDHIIAYLLKLTFPHLYWIADFRDLHVDPINRNVISPLLQRKINRFFFKKADIITTVSRGLERHLKYYGVPTYTLRNGIQSFRHPHKLSDPVLPFFTVAYTGSLFKEKRRPDVLLASTRELIHDSKREMRIIYAGKDGASWLQYIRRYGLEEYAVDKGFISLPEARELQNNAHINLLLTYSSAHLTGNLTSKLYEYFAARKPIIAIVNGTRDHEIEQLFEDINAGLVVYHDEPDAVKKISAFIQKYYSQWLADGRINPPISEKDLEQFQWSGLFNGLMEKINPCTKF